MKLISVLIAAAFIGGWIYLLKYVRTKAGEQNAEGEEFRTGRPPTWRVILYVLIAMAIPFYFFYPRLNELSPKIKPLFWIMLFVTGASVIFAGIIMPWFAKEKKVWITEHKKLILYVVYIAFAISILLKLWDMFHK